MSLGGSSREYLTLPRSPPEACNPGHYVNVVLNQKLRSPSEKGKRQHRPTDRPGQCSVDRFGSGSCLLTAAQKPWMSSDQSGQKLVTRGMDKVVAPRQAAHPKFTRGSLMGVVLAVSCSTAAGEPRQTPLEGPLGKVIPAAGLAA